MKSFSLSCLAIIASTAALVCCGVADRAFADAPRDTGTRTETVSTEPQMRTASVTYHVADGLYLGEPKTTGRERLESLIHLTDVGEKGAGFAFTYKPWGFDEAGAKAFGEVSWPLILQSGRAAGSVTTRLSFGQGHFEQPCTVRNPSGEVAPSIRCSVVQRNLDNDWDMYITDGRVDKVAEASGAIRAEGSVGLAIGEFTTDSEMRLDPAAWVKAGASTQFDAVRMRSDESGDPDTAQMTFKYALLDDGEPAYSRNGQRLYVEGTVSNGRGGRGNASCRIITADNAVDKSAPFWCKVSASHSPAKANGNAQYIGDFTVTDKK